MNGRARPPAGTVTLQPRYVPGRKETAVPAGAFSTDDFQLGSPGLTLSAPTITVQPRARTACSCSVHLLDAHVSHTHLPYTQAYAQGVSRSSVRWNPGEHAVSRKRRPALQDLAGRDCAPRTRLHCSATAPLHDKNAASRRSALAECTNSHKQLRLCLLLPLFYHQPTSRSSPAARTLCGRARAERSKGQEEGR